MSKFILFHVIFGLLKAANASMMGRESVERSLHTLAHLSSTAGARPAPTMFMEYTFQFSSSFKGIESFVDAGIICNGSDVVPPEMQQRHREVMSYLDQVNLYNR